MKLKKIFTMLFVTVFMLATAGIALALDRVEVKVTSEPIMAKATCDKAGGFSLEFDGDTILTDGDQITIDVDYINGSAYTSLCRDIDIVIAPLDDVILTPGSVSGTSWDGTSSIANENSPVYSTGIAMTSIGGIFFHITGQEGTQRITVDILGVNAGDFVQVGDDPDDVMVISFFDQQTNDDYSTNGIYYDPDDDDDDTTHVYDNDAEMAHNTPCINVSQRDEATVDANMDSKEDKYTFIPSDPQIAHIVSASEITLENCKGAKTGYIPLPEEQADCDPFDYETGIGYCFNTHEDNHVLLVNTGSFPEVDYQIQLEIVEPGSGVYWSDGEISAQGYEKESDACSDDDASTKFATADYEYHDADSDKLENADIVSSPDACEIDKKAKAVKILTDVDEIFGYREKVAWIDMPDLIYDNSVSSGQVVKVTVKLIKAPCGELFSGDVTVGTFGCQAAEESNNLLYPYFTAMEHGADAFWDGFVVINTGNIDGTAKLTIYEMDGDVATMEIEVPAHGMYVNMLSAMVAEMTLITSVDGTLGNARCYISVSADFTCDGFAMIAVTATGESMGYLPRK